MRIFRKQISFGLITLFCFVLFTHCANKDYTPKPHGYFRITLPNKEYQTTILDGCPFTVETPIYTKVTDDHSKNAQQCWKNIDFPLYNARLHLSYIQITSATTLTKLSEDARSFAFKHTSKATGIDQINIIIPEHQIFGLEYHIKGNTASNYQFFVSDNNKNYLRGALYFNEKPNLDSIQPVLDFVKEDIQHIIHSIRWK